jgi:hypothetical protein
LVAGNVRLFFEPKLLNKELLLEEKPDVFLKKAGKLMADKLMKDAKKKLF